MNHRNSIAEIIEDTDRKARYDMQVKEIFAEKSILAPILKTCVEECRDMSIEEIKDCIQGEISISSERVAGYQQEDPIRGEGYVTYDLRFDLMLPDEKCTTIKIDLEGQQKSTTYDLTTRGIFYTSRMISSQLKNDFDIKQEKSYNNLKKVYSIFICMSSDKKDRDTITKYSFVPENVYGDFRGNARYDLAVLVMVRLTYDGTESENGLIDMLTTLLSNKLSAEEKERILESKHGIPMTTELKGKVIKMCNFSEVIEENAIKKGIKQGMERGMEQGMEQGVELQKRKVIFNMYKKGFSYENIADANDISVDEVKEYLSQSMALQ